MPHDATVSGRRVLGVTAVLSAVFAAAVLGVGVWVNQHRPDERPDWRRRADWPAFPVKPVSRPDQPRAPGEARPPRNVALPPSVTPEVRRELERLATLAASPEFAAAETGEVLRASIRKHPGLFYPRFLLASWLAMRVGEGGELLDGADIAGGPDALMGAAFDRADAAITLRYVTPGRQAAAGLRVGAMALAYELWEDRRATDRLVLVYPLVVTDRLGRVSIPVYQGVYTVEAWPAVGPEYEVDYVAPPLFAFPPPVAALPDAVVAPATTSDLESTRTDP